MHPFSIPTDLPNSELNAKNYTIQMPLIWLQSNFPGKKDSSSKWPEYIKIARFWGFIPAPFQEIYYCPLRYHVRTRLGGGRIRRWFATTKTCVYQSGVIGKNRANNVSHRVLPFFHSFAAACLSDNELLDSNRHLQPAWIPADHKPQARHFLVARGWGVMSPSINNTGTCRTEISWWTPRNIY